jgi:O-methyltransferase
MSLTRRIYDRMPEGTKPALRSLRGMLRHVPGSRDYARTKWVGSYTAFQMAERDTLFRRIAYFCHVNRPMEGYYMEFGCHEANTMRLAWQHSRFLFNWAYIAFDSFEGFPEITEIDQQEIWAPGKCATDEIEFRRRVERAGMPGERLRTVKGFYDASLTETLRDQLLPTKAAVVYVDCDLYESTVPVLEFMAPFLQRGTIVVFDDWNCFWGDPDRGERLAWREFRERYPELRFESFHTDGMAKAFICINSGETA